MPTTIKLKNSVTTTSVPSSLVQGEVAINITDKKVWVGNAATTPIQLLGGGADGNFTNISVSSVATFGAGTVSAPSITTTGDTNTGIYFPAADTIAFTEGGVEAMRISANGTVGIGTTTTTDAGVTITTNVVRDDSYNAKIALQSSSAGDYPALLFSGCSATNRNGAIIQTASTSGNSSTQITSAIVFPNPTSTTGAISFWTNGNVGTTAYAERMRIDSSGNVGIGTSSPSSYVSNGGLAIDNTVATNAGQVVNLLSSGSSWFKIGRLTASSTAILQSGQDLALQPDSGNVCIGTTTTPNQKAVIYRTSATTSNGALLLDGNGSYAGLQFAVSGTLQGSISSDLAALYITHEDVIAFNTGGSGNVGGTERMRILSGGSVCVNTTAAVVDSTSRLIVSTTTASGIAAEFSNNTSGTACVAINNLGAATSTLINWYAANNYRSAVTWDGTNIIYGTPSDQRLKENIVSASSALPLINEIKIRSFDWKENGKHIDFGVIAQELVSVVPEAVLKGKDNQDGSIKESWSVDTSTLVPALIKAVQELNAKVVELEAKLNAK
jgi:hypothetical protein